MILFLAVWSFLGGLASMLGLAVSIKVWQESKRIEHDLEGDEGRYGFCEYSAIHRETPHPKEPGCYNWKALS